MKYLVVLILISFSFCACSKEESKPKAKVDAKVNAKAELSTDKKAPCDTKEDLLKKLEEKQKAEAEKGKGFSLQGGNTGCSVK